MEMDSFLLMLDIIRSSYNYISSLDLQDQTDWVQRHREGLCVNPKAAEILPERSMQATLVAGTFSNIQQV